MAELIVRKRGDKWEYRFEAAKINGKRRQITKGGFATKKQASQAGAKAFTEYNETGVHFVPSEKSFADYLQEWMEAYCKVNLKPTTIENYEKRIRIHIVPALGAYKLCALTPSLLQNFINKIFNQGYSRNTLMAIRRILSGSLNYAVLTLRLIQANPMDAVRMPSNRAIPEVPTRSAPNVYITPNEIRAIFERFPEGSSAFIPMQLGYRCGLRLGEAFAVCWEDVDFEKRTIDINKQVQWDESKQSWYFTAPKYNSFRNIDMDDELYEILKREYEKQKRAKVYYDDFYCELYEDQKRYINKNKDGVRIHPVMVRDNGAYIAPRIMQHTSGIIHHQLGFKNFTFHSFRHTHATMLAESGAPIKYTQDRLGHKDINVTMQIYQHASDTIRRIGADVINKMFTSENMENATFDDLKSAEISEIPSSSKILEDKWRAREQK